MRLNLEMKISEDECSLLFYKNWRVQYQCGRGRPFVLL